MRVLLSLSLLLLLSLSSATTLSTTENFLSEVLSQFYEGVIKGIVSADKEIEVWEYILTPPCTLNSNIETTIASLDSSVNSLTLSSNLSSSVLQELLQTISGVLQKSMIPALVECGANNSMVSPIASVLQPFNQSIIVNYTDMTLTIGEIEVYSELATFVGSWQLSNYHQAGYYWGNLLRILNIKSKDGMSCAGIGMSSDFSVFAASSYAKLYSALSFAAKVTTHEKVLIPLNNFEEWNWCDDEFNPSVDICTNGNLGQEQSLALDSTTHWQSTIKQDNGYFTQFYEMFLTELRISNATEDKIVKTLQIEQRQYDHRAAQAQNETMPAYETYANSTQNPIAFALWASTICSLSECQVYVQSMNASSLIAEQLSYIYTHSTAAVILNALNKFEDTDYYCNYTSVANGPVLLSPCWYTSLMPSEWLENYNNNLYQGGLFVEVHNKVNYDHLCSGGFADIDSALIQKMEQQQFLKVQYNGTWHQLEYNLFTEEIEILYSAQSVSRVDVTPGEWFSEDIMWRFRNSTATAGGLNSSTYFDPTTGILNAMVSGILVASDIHIQINGSQTVGYAIQDVFSTNNITGIQVGPFFANGISWDTGVSTLSFANNNNQSANAPYIIGYVIRQLPYDTTPTSAANKNVRIV